MTEKLILTVAVTVLLNLYLNLGSVPTASSTQSIGIKVASLFTLPLQPR